jgi:hypothetical protein
MLYVFVPEGAHGEQARNNAPSFDYSLDSALTLARSRWPDFTAHYIKTPRNPRDSLLSVWGDLPGGFHLGSFATSLDVNVYTGEIRYTRESDLDPVTQTLLTLNTMHGGQFAGIAGRVVYLFLALTTAALSISGYVLWWKRMRRGR